jgi:hypothetical protein
MFNPPSMAINNILRLLFLYFGIFFVNKKGVRE